MKRKERYTDDDLKKAVMAALMHTRICVDIVGPAFAKKLLLTYYLEALERTLGDGISIVEVWRPISYPVKKRVVSMMLNITYASRPRTYMYNLELRGGDDGDVVPQNRDIGSPSYVAPEGELSEELVREFVASSQRAAKIAWEMASYRAKDARESLLANVVLPVPNQEADPRYHTKWKRMMELVLRRFPGREFTMADLKRAQLDALGSESKQTAIYGLMRMHATTNADNKVADQRPRGYPLGDAFFRVSTNNTAYVAHGRVKVSQHAAIHGF